MKLLLDAKASLTARDTSFGDYRTPLHKAAAGGRHLAVQLLLDAWSKVGSNIKEGLELLDARGLTPLDVAKEMQQSKDHDSVKRWDVVAGGPPDWDACVKLLQRAEADYINKSDSGLASATAPAHLLSASSCLDCDGDANNGRCLTLSLGICLSVSLAFFGGPVHTTHGRRCSCNKIFPCYYFNCDNADPQQYSSESK